MTIYILFCFHFLYLLSLKFCNLCISGSVVTQEEQVNDTPRTDRSSEHLFSDVSQCYIVGILYAAILLVFLLLLSLMDCCACGTHTMSTGYPSVLLTELGKIRYPFDCDL